jgi:ribonuclease HI
MGSSLKPVVMYTDGACVGNPGPGGYAAVILFGAHRKEISGGYRLTTNNRMEIMAAIAGLTSLNQPCAVTLYTDSQYLANAISKGWAKRWRANGWMRTKSDRALNPDLWEQLLDLCAKHDVEFVWVRGHAGNAENERCDALSTAFCRQRDLPPDLAFERGQK